MKFQMETKEMWVSFLLKLDSVKLDMVSDNVKTA